MIALFLSLQIQPEQIFTQRLANERGAVSLQPARSLIGRAQQFFLEDNLDRLYMWSLLHNLFHIHLDGTQAGRPGKRTRVHIRIAARTARKSFYFLFPVSYLAPIDRYH
jgi:hypothetical protein